MIILFFIFFFFIVITFVVQSLSLGISPTPTSIKVKKVMLEAIQPYSNGTIYELGCGFGTLLFPIGKSFSNSRVYGFEKAWIPLAILFIRYKLSSFKNIKIRNKDFFLESLSDANLVVCYLFPRAMYKLSDKFKKELKPGTIVVSNTFAIPSWSPIKVYEVSDLYKTKVYLYKVK